MSNKDLTAKDRPVVEHARPVSKGQKSFNALVTKIKVRRAKLAEWNTYSEEFNRRYNGEFVPQRRKLDEVRTQLIVRLDQSHDLKGLTKTERQTIESLIVHIAEQILMSGDDPVAMELYHRYDAPDAGEEEAIHADLKNAFKEAFAFDIPEDVDMTSSEELFSYIQEQLDQQERQDDQQRRAREEGKAGRKKAKSAKAAKAAEERARTEEAEVHLSLREVYRKLVSALHPDRETDPVERERKAALMQRVNRAYADRSLLDLLEIQIELEHIDQAALESVSAERLNRWNAILKEQLEGLDHELLVVDGEMQMRCGMEPIGPTSPKIIKRMLGQYISDLNDFVRAFEDDLREFDDIKRLKLWLKAMRWKLESVNRR